MPKTFRRSKISVKKSLAPPFSNLVGVESSDYGYEASYDGYSSTGDSKDDAVHNLIDKLQSKGYEEE